MFDQITPQTVHSCRCARKGCGLRPHSFDPVLPNMSKLLSADEILTFLGFNATSIPESLKYRIVNMLSTSAIIFREILLQEKQDKFMDELELPYYSKDPSSLFAEIFRRLVCFYVLVVLVFFIYSFSHLLIPL